MQAYQQILDRIEALGATLVAVSPELPDNSLTTAETNALRFEVLSDPGNSVARSYGLVFRLETAVIDMYLTSFQLNLPIRNGDDTWELPVPGLFVIGVDETIRFAHVDPDYTRRAEPLAILQVLKTG